MGESKGGREEAGTTTEGIWALKILNLLLQGNGLKSGLEVQQDQSGLRLKP